MQKILVKNSQVERIIMKYCEPGHFYSRLLLVGCFYVGGGGLAWSVVLLLDLLPISNKMAILKIDGTMEKGMRGLGSLPSLSFHLSKHFLGVWP